MVIGSPKSGYLCFLLLKNTRQKCLCAFPFRCLLSEKIILWFPLHCNIAMRKRNFFPVSLLQPFPMVTHYSISITEFHLWNLKFQYADFWLWSLILGSCHFDIHRLFFSSVGTSGLWILLFFSWWIVLPKNPPPLLPLTSLDSVVGHFRCHCQHCQGPRSLSLRCIKGASFQFCINLTTFFALSPECLENTIMDMELVSSQLLSYIYWSVLLLFFFYVLNL